MYFGKSYRNYSVVCVCCPAWEKDKLNIDPLLNFLNHLNCWIFMNFRFTFLWCIIVSSISIRHTIITVLIAWVDNFSAFLAKLWTIYSERYTYGSSWVITKNVIGKYFNLADFVLYQMFWDTSVFSSKAGNWGSSLIPCNFHVIGGPFLFAFPLEPRTTSKPQVVAAVKASFIVISFWALSNDA